MNKDNVLAVADAIEKHSIPDLGFNMAGWMREAKGDDRSGHECGTVACIAGWAHAVSGGSLTADTGTIRDAARAFLGLDDSFLFLGVGYDGYAVPSMEAVTPSQAVRVLRHLAETGEVDWSVSETASA